MKGVEYLISNKLVENNPVSVAQFLKTANSLDKVQCFVKLILDLLYRIA